MKTIFLTILFSVTTTWAYNADHIQQAAQENNIPDTAIQYLLNYLRTHETQFANKNYVTFVDFRLPSNLERMFIINANTGQTEKFLVAHGVNSGDVYAERFSNIENSRMSSLGLYRIEEKYLGDNGASLYLSGLSTTNSNVKTRSIVMHHAEYVSDQWVAQNGKIGNSWGCFALNKTEFLRNAIDKVRDGSLMLAFK